MHTTAIDSDKHPIWARIRSIYDRMRAKMQKEMMQKDADKQTLWDRIRGRLRK